MAKISIIEPKISPFKKRNRVAAYARVSAETERLQHSLSAQVSYYSELIQKNPEWEYAGVFADYGISGTGMKNRSELQRLLTECEKGNIDIILTKSISRFARNTVDLLATVRHLKEIGIEVRFEKEKINSFSDDGELMLSLLASFAQEESRSISENCKWGIRKRFESGEIGTANKHLLGYRYDEELKKYIIIPEEAESVRWMFQMFLDGMPYRQIASALNEAGVRSIYNNKFVIGTVKRLVENEVYVGDTLRQKSYIVDPISKTKVKNDGVLPQYYVRDSHEGIIDRDTYEKVQLELKRREALVNPTYCFTGKIRCGICGRNFSRRKNLRTASWTCRCRKEPVERHECVSFFEEKLKEICAEMLEIDEFDESVFENSIKKMTVLGNGDIRFNFIGGKTKVWKMPQKPVKPKTEKEYKRPPNIFDGMIFCGKCGRRFGRAITDSGQLCWRCRAKASSGTTCDSVNYLDSDIRKIFCKVFAKEQFDEQFFIATVDKVVIQEYGSINFHLKSGGIKHFETLKRRSNYNHITTETDEFANKFICAGCGKYYHKYKCKGKYVYWLCSGMHTKEDCKTKIRFTDFDLRQISAYILGTNGFDGDIFLEKIEKIIVEEDGSLTYYFYGGDIKKWQEM